MQTLRGDFELNLRVVKDEYPNEPLKSQIDMALEVTLFEYQQALGRLADEHVAGHQDATNKYHFDHA